MKITTEEIINIIIDEEGDCSDISAEDCEESCPLNTLCSKIIASTMIDAPQEEKNNLILKWATIVKRNNYKLSDSLLFDEVL